MDFTHLNDRWMGDYRVDEAMSHSTYQQGWKFEPSWHNTPFSGLCEPWRPPESVHGQINSTTIIPGINAQKRMSFDLEKCHLEKDGDR